MMFFLQNLLKIKDALLILIIEFLFETCSELVWWLPAHNVYQRDGYNSGYPDTTRPIIALFSAETAAQISIIVNTFEKQIPKELINTVNKQLEERIFTPFEKSSFWWMAKEGDLVNNWIPGVLKMYYYRMLFHFLFKKKECLSLLKSLAKY